jgi:hypothetical protein
MKEQVLPFLRKWVHTMDDDGALLSDNFLLSKVLRYGVRDARKMNRISSTLLFPEMLPNYVVDAITALARGEQPLRRLRRNAMRVEALPDWLEINPQGQRCGDRGAANSMGQKRGQSAGTAAWPIRRDSRGQSAGAAIPA